MLYNPRIYNYSNLKKEDQIIVDYMIYLTDSIEEMKYDYDTDMNTSHLEKIFNETAVEVVDEVIERVIEEILEFIVSTIENYDEDIEEIDTDDFLYGMK